MTNLPKLWGDGVHDDTDAMQAIIKGEAYIDMRHGGIIVRPPLRCPPVDPEGPRTAYC